MTNTQQFERELQQMLEENGREVSYSGIMEICDLVSSHLAQAEKQERERCMDILVKLGEKPMEIPAGEPHEQAYEKGRVDGWNSLLGQFMKQLESAKSLSELS